MRRATFNLAVDLTIKLYSFDEPRMEDMMTVLDWVLMINPTATTKMSVGSKRKCADDPINKPILTPPLPLPIPINSLHSPPSLPMRFNEGNVL